MSVTVKIGGGAASVRAPASGAPKFVEKLLNVEVNVGKTAIIDCVCEGKPEPDIDWKFEGKLINDEGRFRYLYEKDDVVGLEIKKIRLEDEGEYTCVASNRSGTAECKCEILVNDPTKKKEPEPKPVVKDTKSTPAPSTAAPEKISTQGFKPVTIAKGRKKKQKLPIQRDGITAENPEKHYNFGDEIGRGKFAVVRECTSKRDGSRWAAKIIKYSPETLKFALREFDMMMLDKMKLKGLVQLHEAYLVRKYLILIMDLVDGKTILDYMSKRHSLNEDDVAQVVRQMVTILSQMHANNLVHLDIRPTNIRVAAGASREVMIVDYNSCRSVANKRAGEVVDVIGDTEFCAPELLRFEPVLPASDMWSVAVITYILLSGISPFYYEDEDMVCESVERVKWKFDTDAFSTISSEAKDFISKCLIRAPEMRMEASEALKHDFLKADFANKRKRSHLSSKTIDIMRETDERLLGEEEEDYIDASLVFRTFDEEEYESPEESSEEEED